MRKSPIFILSMAVTGLFISCKKDGFPSLGIAAVNMVNARIANNPVLVYFTSADSNFYLQKNTLYPQSNKIYSVIPGNSPLNLYSSDDTTRPLYRTLLSLKTGAVYTLYLSGIDKQVDTFLLEDNIPVHPDSVAGIRFINLSPGSQPMTVNLLGNTSTQTEVDGLSYKQISNFKSYPISGDGIYYFEIRDKATGDLLTTFGWVFSPYKNYTLVIDGSEDPNQSMPVNVFAVNNFSNQ